MKKISLIAVLVVALLSSCDSYMATGAMTGGLLGQAIGGIAGGRYGASVGTLVGAAAGATVGAAAREAEARRSEARYYDDVYSSGARAQTRDAKAERIARYHAKTKAKYSGRGYSRSQSGYSESSSTRYSGNGFTLETEGRSYQKNPVDSSGFTEKATYDDRIEMK